LQWRLPDLLAVGRANVKMADFFQCCFASVSSAKKRVDFSPTPLFIATNRKKAQKAQLWLLIATCLGVAADLLLLQVAAVA